MPGSGDGLILRSSWMTKLCLCHVRVATMCNTGDDLLVVVGAVECALAKYSHDAGRMQRGLQCGWIHTKSVQCVKGKYAT